MPWLQDAAKEEADIAVKEALDAQEKPDVEHEVAAAIEKALSEERARVAEVSHCIQEPSYVQGWGCCLTANQDLERMQLQQGASQGCRGEPLY